jgi:molybdopterin-synthase adenylyltransferase
MNDQQLLRYSRHILLPEIGIDGQGRLLASHALIIGVGGLGSPAAMYLASSGVGKLTLCDGDTVDLTNLQRQLLHRTSTIGSAKVFSAKQALSDINPEVEVFAQPLRVDEQQLMNLVAQADVVLDCSDNFATRYALNRACLAQGKPLVSGAATRFDGQVSVFDFRRSDSPCYNCLYPEHHDAEETRCAVMGVFAPAVGVIGALQAAEGLKLLLNIGAPSYGRLLLADILNLEIRSTRLFKDAACPACGK